MSDYTKLRHRISAAKDLWGADGQWIQPEEVEPLLDRITALEEGIRVLASAAKPVYDLAINSMDNGSGFWDLEECQAAYRLGRLFGIESKDVLRDIYSWAKNWPDPEMPDVEEHAATLAALLEKGSTR